MADLRGRRSRTHDPSFTGTASAATGVLEQPLTQRPSHEWLPDPAIVVAGCHGGAGTSTLARLLTGAIDAGVGVPAETRYPIVLVARGTPHGGSRASEMLRDFQQHELQPSVLVVVGDGPWPEPPLSRSRFRLLSGLVPTVVRVRFVPRWRYLDAAPTQAIPAKVDAALQRIRAAAHPNPSGEA